MATWLHAGLQDGGLTQYGLHKGLSNLGLFSGASLDLRFADTKSLVDTVTGQSLVTFTRASSGTYVGSDGLIKTATTNLLLRSEEIGTSPWGTNNAGATTYTANATAAPTGTVTADRVTVTADFAGPNQFVSATSGLSYSLSFYVKAVTPGSLDSIRIECFSGRFATFNITTRVFSGVNAAVTPSSVSLGDGWVRVQCLFTAPSTGSLAVAVYANTSSDFYLWGAQLEQSSTVGEYIPTTSTINSAPRFDHHPTTGESLGLLVEEQRTNVILRSEEFNNAIWGKDFTSATADAGVAPNGETTADKIAENSSNNFHAVSQYVAGFASGAVVTLSIYVKAAGRTRFRIQTDSTGGTGTADFDLSAVTATAGTGVFSNGAINNAGSGWYRCSVVCTTSAAGTIGLKVILAQTTYGTTYTGDGTSGVLLWGAQLEAGSFPTSYIPTTTATVTRSADVASITGTAFSSWYRQDEGTVFADARTNATHGGVNSFPRLSALNDGTNNNAIENYLRVLSSYTDAGYRVAAGGVAQAQFDTNNERNGQKQCVGYAANNFAFAVRGTVENTDTSGSVPVITQLRIGARGDGSSSCNGTIRRLTYWPARLPNSALQQITA